MIRLMRSTFQSITPAQLNVKSRITSPSENFLKDALGRLGCRQWKVSHVSRAVARLCQFTITLRRQASRKFTWIGNSSECDHLVQQNSKRPHIRLGAELARESRLRCSPFDGKLGRCINRK